jgi:hypothetical protein
LMFQSTWDENPANKTEAQQAKPLYATGTLTERPDGPLTAFGLSRQSLATCHQAL